jgi:hypothetical protein
LLLGQCLLWIVVAGAVLVMDCCICWWDDCCGLLLLVPACLRVILEVYGGVKLAGVLMLVVTGW